MNDQRTLIDVFLGCRRIAVVGVSRNSNDFTRQLWKEFSTRGGVPVHPSQDSIDGVPCFKNLRSVDPRPEAALVLVGKENLRAVLEECDEAAVRLVWIYGVSGPKSVGADILRWCDDHEIRVIAGYCPFMFLPGMSWPHRLHGTVARWIGQYPG